MEVGKSLTYLFEDDKWLKKFIIGGLILLVTGLLFWSVIALFIGGALILGYMVEIVRNVRKNAPEPLPEWDDLGGKFVTGIKLMGILFIWSLPLIILEAPSSLLSWAFDSNNVLVGLLLAGFACLAFLYAIFLMLATPTLTIRLAETDDFSSGFEFGEIWDFTRDNIGDILIAVVLVFIVYIVSIFAGLIVCGVGVAFTMFYVTLVQGHIYGQIGREDTYESLAPYVPSPEDAGPDADALPDNAQSDDDTSTS